MPNIIGIQFRSSSLIYYFKNGKCVLEIGDLCVVKTSLGLDIGQVVTPIQFLSDEEVETPLKKVIRKATNDDIEKWNVIQEEEETAFHICHGKIKKHHLDMHLIRTKYLFDKSRLIFYFCADNRIDFRELVKDLASVFKTKIELKQIGVRDKAKMVGGLGICGRSLCCTTFLTDFKPVPINVAKMQSVALNLSKVSGTCGRLKCCLNYESQFYKEELKKYPKLGSRIKTTDNKEGKIIEVNILSRYMVLETIERDGNENIKNRIKISIDEWLNNQHYPNKEKDNAANRSQSERNNRVPLEKQIKNHSE